MRQHQYIPPSTPPAAREPHTRCARSCCWTPFGHTPREGCTCHTAPTTTGPVNVCPECVQGKHGNCGPTLDRDDEWVPCDCSLDHQVSS